MTKRLLLNQVTLCADGSIGLQWLKLITDPDTGEVLMSEPHRSVVDFNGDADGQMDAAFAHLSQMGYVASADDIAAHKKRVKAIDKIARADPAIEAVRQAKIEAAQAVI